MTHYDICGRVDGHYYGTYEGDTPEVAVRVLLEEGGCHDEPDMEAWLVRRARVIVDGREVDYDAAVMLMDDDIRNRLHDDMPLGVSAQDFVDAYCAAHRDAFGEDFVVM